MGRTGDSGIQLHPPSRQYNLCVSLGQKKGRTIPICYEGTEQGEAQVPVGMWAPTCGEMKELERPAPDHSRMPKLSVALRLWRSPR